MNTLKHIIEATPNGEACGAHYGASTCASAYSPVGTSVRSGGHHSVLWWALAASVVGTTRSASGHHRNFRQAGE